jgi:beta-1,4-mannosyltransferase
VNVLESVEEPTTITNPYILQLLASMRDEGIDVRYFSWRTAFAARFDVFHVHWPELIVRAPTTSRRLAKTVLFATLIYYLRLRRIPIVWTVHNANPHESGGWPLRRLLKHFSRNVSTFILLNAAEVPSSIRGRRKDAHVILHGHYRDWFAEHPAPAKAKGRILCFGLLRPYKGAEALITAFTSTSSPEMSLHIVGKPVPPEYGDQLLESNTGDDRVRLLLSFLSDEELRREIGEAELVALPYREMYNSGSALLALSLDRPILVPDSPSNRALRAEIGARWVNIYDPPLTGEVLENALAEAGSISRAEEPDLSAREWTLIGLRHRVLFQSLQHRGDH